MRMGNSERTKRHASFTIAVDDDELAQSDDQEATSPGHQVIAKRIHSESAARSPLQTITNTSPSPGRHLVSRKRKSLGPVDMDCSIPNQHARSPKRYPTLLRGGNAISSPSRSKSVYRSLSLWMPDGIDSSPLAKLSRVASNLSSCSFNPVSSSSPCRRPSETFGAKAARRRKPGAAFEQNSGRQRDGSMVKADQDCVLPDLLADLRIVS